MIHSHSTNHNLVPSNSVDCRTVTSSISPIWTFPIETTLCGVQDVNLHLTIKKLRNHWSQQWQGKAEQASAMIFIWRLMPKALQMEIPPERGFHGSLARSYGLSNHKRYCLKHTMITSMNEYNSEVYKSDRILTGEYFSRLSLLLTCPWSSSVESGSLPNSWIWLLPQMW